MQECENARFGKGAANQTGGRRWERWALRADSWRWKAETTREVWCGVVWCGRGGAGRGVIFTYIYISVFMILYLCVFVSPYLYIQVVKYPSSSIYLPSIIQTT
jgi:hypothetical protein